MFPEKNTEDMTLFVLNGSNGPGCTPRKIKILNSTVIVGVCVYEYESVLIFGFISTNSDFDNVAKICV